MLKWYRPCLQRWPELDPPFEQFVDEPSVRLIGVEAGEAMRRVLLAAPAGQSGALHHCLRACLPRDLSFV